MIVLVVPLLVAALVYGGLEAFRRRRSVDLRRLAPLAGGAAFAALLGGTVLGGSSGASERMLILGAVLFAGLAFVLGRSSRVAVEGSWAGPSVLASRPPRANRASVPSAAAVARALGRAEARELSRSPWFGIGFGFCVLVFVLFGFVWAAEDSGTWDGQLQLSSWFAYPLVGMVVLAMHRAVNRAARDGADEVFDACPTGPATRTAGFLLAAVLPMATLAVFLVALGVAVAANGARLYGRIGADSVADVAAAVVLGAGGVALGVALGRWVRFALAPVVAVVAVGLAGIQLNVQGGSGWNPLVPLSTAPAVDGTPPIFADRPVWWHLLWVAGLTAAVGVVALARHRRDLAVAVAGAVAVIVVIVAAIGATRPLPPATAARIAAAVANPEATQECAATGPVEVCVYPLYRALLGPVTDRVAPVANVLPANLAPLTLRQVFEDELDELPPEVRRLLTEADLARPGGEVPLGFDGGIIERSGSDLAFGVVGLPVEAGEDLLPVVVGGQARGVVALWLATRGLDAEATDSEIADASTGAKTLELCDVPAVTWSAQDLIAARAVVALPETDVARELSNDWERWIDPRTSTDELLTALRLDEVGPFDEVGARPGRPC